MFTKNIFVNIFSQTKKGNIVGIFHGTQMTRMTQIYLFGFR